MAFSVEVQDDAAVVVSCPEEMEWDAREDLETLVSEAAPRKNYKGVILDFGKVSFVSSAGLGAIMLLRDYAQRHNVKLVVARPRPLVVRLFNEVCLPKIIRIADTMAAARDFILSE